MTATMPEVLLQDVPDENFLRLLKAMSEVPESKNRKPLIFARPTSLRVAVRAPVHRVTATGFFPRKELSANRVNGVKSQPMDIKRAGSQPSNKGPAEWFTGTVRIEHLFQPESPARVAGASVTFEPGARTAWHTHPLGQTLVVTAGFGRAQREGGAVEEIRPGDVVWFAPGEKHWHGASATTAMTHLAIQERLDGKAVDWLEHVSDAEYQG